MSTDEVPFHKQFVPVASIRKRIEESDASNEGDDYDTLHEDRFYLMRHYDDLQEEKNSWRMRWAGTVEDSERYLEAIWAVKSLHTNETPEYDGDSNTLLNPEEVAMCNHCWLTWPCPTIQALDNV